MMLPEAFESLDKIFKKEYGFKKKLVPQLEDEQFDSIEILKQIVKDEILAPLPLLTFCSPECEETLQKAAALGVVVTPRSTFASNIVGMIKALVQSEDPA